MYPSTENLLKIRDGEPIDADALAYVEADPSARAELLRLRQTQLALNDLPTIEPPSGSWDKIVAAVDLDTSRTPSPNWRWPLRAAIAASVATAALMLIARTADLPTAVDLAPATIVADTAPTNQIADLVGTPSYASLVTESGQLDHALNRITYQPRVVRAGTASTMANLEDRIAIIDYQLNMAPRLGLGQHEIRTLWQLRIDLMRGLIYMRSAQAQRSGY
jgi:hypothetical protein